MTPTYTETLLPSSCDLLMILLKPQHILLDCQRVQYFHMISYSYESCDYSPLISQLSGETALAGTTGTVKLI